MMTRQTMMTADCTAWQNIATGMMRVSGKSSVDDAGRSAGLSAQRSPEQINEHHDDYYKGGKGQDALRLGCTACGKNGIPPADAQWVQQIKGKRYGSMSRGKRSAGKNKGHDNGYGKRSSQALYSGNGYSRALERRKGNKHESLDTLISISLKKESLSQQTGINNNVLFYNHRFPLLDSGDELLGVGKKYYHQPIPHRDDNKEEKWEKVHLPCSWKALPRIHNLSCHTIKGEKRSIDWSGRSVWSCW